MITDSWDCVRENRRAKQDAEKRSEQQLCFVLNCQLFSTLGLQPARLRCPWDSPGNTGMGCDAPLQGPNLRLFMSPALAGRFFTINTTQNLVTFDVGVMTQGYTKTEPVFNLKDHYLLQSNN